MLTRRAPFVALVSVVIMLGTSGCFASSPAPAPSTSAAPGASPLFASDEEALAAATEAYAAYLEVADSVGASGGVEVELLAQLVTSAYMENQRASYLSLGTSQIKTQGTSTFQAPRLQAFDSEFNQVTIYVCVDVSDVRIIGANGGDVTPPDRPATYPLTVRFATENATSRLLVDSSESWTGDNFCSV